MLVLTRRANQSIMIGHEIVVTVLEVRGDQVRLGIKAPRSIDVHREEIFAQLQQANRDAVQSSKQALESLQGMTPPPTAEERARVAARRRSVRVRSNNRTRRPARRRARRRPPTFATSPRAVFTPSRERAVGLRRALDAVRRQLERVRQASRS